MNNQIKWVEEVLATIPSQESKEIHKLSVLEAGFAAGPGFVAGKIHPFDNPVSMNEALIYLSTYADIFRRAHLKFENGKKMYVDRQGYYSLRNN
jgi:hypothetical protein